METMRQCAAGGQRHGGNRGFTARRHAFNADYRAAIMKSRQKTAGRMLAGLRSMAVSAVNDQLLPIWRLTIPAIVPSSIQEERRRQINS